MNLTEIAVLYLLTFRVMIVASGALSILLGYKLLCKGLVGQFSKDNNSTIEASVIGTRLTVRNAAPGTAFAIFGAGILIVMMIQSAPSVTLEYLSKLTTREPGASTAETHGESGGTIGPASQFKGSTPVERQNSKQENIAPPVSNLKAATTAERTEEAEDSVRVVMRGNNQTSLFTLTAKGVEFEKRGDQASAERSYREAVNLMAEPINDLAWQYFKSGRPGDALKLADIAVQLSPDEPRYKRTADEARKAVK